MNTRFTPFLVLASAFLLSCLGTAGPAGPPGPDGRDGLDGAQVYSESIVIDADIDFGVVDSLVSVASYGWNILDEATVDNGMVLGYLRFQGSTSWNALPFNVPFVNDLVVARYSFDIDNFDLIIEGELAGNNEANEALFDGDILRIVAIPPTQMNKFKGLDYSNYEAVVEAYDITF